MKIKNKKIKNPQCFIPWHPTSRPSGGPRSFPTTTQLKRAVTCTGQYLLSSLLPPSLSTVAAKKEFLLSGSSCGVPAPPVAFLGREVWGTGELEVPMYISHPIRLGSLRLGLVSSGSDGRSSLLYPSSIATAPVSAGSPVMGTSGAASFTDWMRYRIGCLLWWL